VLFSLHELLDLESERLHEEEIARHEKQAEEQRVRLETEQQEREVERARILAQEEQRRRADLRRREELARLSAIQAAELEKARLSAESEVRLRLMAQEQEHQEKIAQIAENGARKKLRVSLVVLALASVGLGIFGAALVRQRDAEAAHEVERLRRAANDREQALDREILRLQDKLKQLDASDDNGRSELRDEIEELSRQRSPLPSTPSSGPTKPKTQDSKKPDKQEPPKPKNPCPEGDPMCPL